jgi:hypothetical protein
MCDIICEECVDYKQSSTLHVRFTSEEFQILKESLFHHATSSIRKSWH